MSASRFLISPAASGIYTAWCIALLCQTASFVVLDTWLNYHYFVFLGSCATFYYSIQKIWLFNGIKNSHSSTIIPKHHRWIFDHPGHLLLLILGSGLMTFAATNWILLSNHGIICLIASALATCYHLPVLNLNLRHLKGMKPFVITVVIILMSTVLPLSESAAPLSKWLIFTTAQSCFIAALCIGSDIGDLHYDQAHQLATIPLIAGLKQSKWIMSLLILAYIGLMGLITERKLFEVFLAHGLISLLFAITLHPNKKVWYFLYGIDGLMALQFLFLFIHFMSQQL